MLKKIKKLKTKYKLMIAFSILAFILILLSMNDLFPFSEKKEEESKAQGIYTELMKVEKGTMIKDLNFIGTVKSSFTSTINPKLTSEIKEIYVKEGDKVNALDILLELDTTQLNASKNNVLQKLTTLETQYSYLSVQINNFYTTNPVISKIATVNSNIAFQEIEVDKLINLYESDAIPKSQLDMAQHQLETLKIQKSELESTAKNNYDQLIHEKNMTSNQLKEIKSSLEEIELSLENAKIKAPFSGQVTQIFAEKGELAMPNKPLLNLSKNDDQKIIVSLSEGDLDKINTLESLEYKIGDNSDMYTGQISSISTNINPVTRMGNVEIPISNSKSYTPGSSARVRFILSKKEDQILIPISAIKNLSDKSVVYIYNEGIVREKEVVLGEKIDNKYQVLSGIKEEDLIATSNIDSLYDSSSVHIFNEEEI